ncbi:taste receptor type 2 member 7-like [Phascolarctos cinereus]|uniref:Taste receptor type 2 n=1 Tax=Phascolarctos cinereus TaxID=38626 RepID=A0A6P5J0D0_PHACI|nr:taste receptor type 2 member 7-like [Phascolarctos cinereus]
MLSSGETIFMVLASAEFLLGILLNGFIILVNCIDWVKSKKLPSSDVILLSLAISRIGLSCTMVWDSYLIVTSINLPTQVRMIDIFLALTHGSNIWFTALLSIFCFLKITNFSNPFFLWMKWRIDRTVVMPLMGPLIIYFSIGFPMMERIYYYHGSLFNRGRERNVSQEVQESKSMYLMLQIAFGLMILIPFTLSAVSFSLFVLSLWRHTRQMRLNATGQRDPSTEAHVRAMKAVSSFLILILLYYVAFFVSYWSNSKDNYKLTSMLGTSIMLLYPFGHSLILILWNSKLRKAALRVSWLMRCC